MRNLLQYSNLAFVRCVIIIYSCCIYSNCVTMSCHITLHSGLRESSDKNISDLPNEIIVRRLDLPHNN